MSFKAILDHAVEHPSNPAVVYNGNVISYAAFANAIDGTVRYLETQEFGAGHTIFVKIDFLIDCWVAVLALQTVGLDTVCINSAEVIETLGIDNVVGIVTTAGEFPGLHLEPNASTGNRVITIPNPVYLDDKLPEGPACKSNTIVGGHTLYTSGTTGKYKKIFFASDLQQKRATQRIEYAGARTDQVCHCANFGLWTAVGYKIPISVWQGHGCVILDQRPDWFRHFLGSGMTEAILVPDMVTQLLDSLEEQSSSTPMDFELHVTAGFLSRKLAERLISRVTSKLIIAYGATETNIAVLQSMAENLDELHWLAPTKYHTVEIVDEAGILCPIDEEGQLRVRLNELDFSSYVDCQEATEKVFISGCFYPGDMAVKRADGRIRILGRSADVLNVRGQKISVAPVEQAIQQRLGLDAVCLFSGINSVGEEELVVVIESEHWPEKSDLSKLSHEFTQFDKVRYAIVHPFPRTQTGTSKIDRVALRKLIFAQRQ